MANPNLALEFLESLKVPGGSLESVGGVGAADPLQVAGPVPEHLEEVVASTVEKIGNQDALAPIEQFALEAIIIPDKRPAIDVRKDATFRIVHPLWRHLGEGDAAANIRKAIPAVGRIELPGHPSLPYGGTGFVVGPDLLMTNRHVAELFANGLGRRGLSFRTGQAAGIDFEQRVDGGSHYLSVAEVILIHPYWDMALLRVHELPDSIVPLRLAAASESVTPREIVVIGYPAFDPRNNVDVQREVFGGVFDVKRLMPGRLNGIGPVDSLGKIVNAGLHDSSTLGGASGSAVLDPHSGAVVALHFGGVYLKSNFGVPAFELSRDSTVIDTGIIFAGHPVAARGPWDDFWRRTETGNESAPRPVLIPALPATPPQVQTQQATFTVPLTFTVSLGVPAPQSAATPRPTIAWGPDGDTGHDVAEVEGVADDYADRTGYDPEFIGRPVPLPFVTRDADDILDFRGTNGGREKILRYQHFSVQMSRSRRMCLWSAVNIDGGQSRKAKRVGWRRDPRIPADAQILNECYGNPPKFSRGHMTRREDPIWGDVDTANRGNADSMCVTNTTPQMQAFNSPIWLALEDYALDHARSDSMRISVFTGPYFAEDDPTRHGVRIPRSFWKVIAFIHDETGELCATGYEMNQEALLPPPETEFVFGEFQSPQQAIATQVSLRSIEARAGLSFGVLADHDPKAGHTESVGADAPLFALEQISFN